MSNPAIESAIEAVTVYRSGALITRVARLECDELPDRVRLVGLPLSLDDGSLRVRIGPPDDGDAKEIGELPVATGLRVGLEAPAGRGAPEPPDEEELREARRQESRLQDSLEQLDREMERLKRLKLSARPPLSWSRDGAPRRANPGAARLELLEFQQRRLEGLLEEQRKLRVAGRALSERVAELEERHRLASTSREAREHELRKSAVITLRREGEGPVAAVIRLEYRVPGARWTPAYALRLDRARGDRIAATLACRAMVCQRTGEEWEDVALTLTTADAQDWCELPELTSMRIGRWQPPPRRRGFKPPPTGVEELFLDFDMAMEPSHRRDEGEAEETTGQFGEETIQAALSTVTADKSWDDDHSITREIRLESPLLRPQAAPAVPSPPPLGAAAGGPPPVAGAVVSNPVVEPRSPTGYGGSVDFDDRPDLLAEAEEPVASMARSAGILSMFGGRRSREGKSLDEWGAAPAVPPPEAPVEPALRPDEDLLSYGKLYMPANTHPRRGVLTVKRRLELYVELLEQQEVTVSFDIDTAVNKARALAQAVAASPTPRGHAVPRPEGGFAHAYPADAPVSLASDGAFHSIPISLRNGTASIRHVAVPRESQDVFRFLELSNPLDAPLLSGPVDVYIDGNYLLTSALSQTAARGQVQLGLGIEPSIKLSRNADFSEETTGLIKGTRALEHQVRIELVNHLDTPASVEIRERLPQPREEDDEIQVEVLRVEPAWEPWEQDDLPLRGGHRWLVRLEGGETTEIALDYVVRIAAKYELVGGNRREA